MSTEPKPWVPPHADFPEGNDPYLHRMGRWLWIPLSREWRDVSSQPEELVRQDFIRHLCDELGYSLDQMGQELRTFHGRRSPKADIVVWATVEDKTNGKSPCLVIECKSEAVEVVLKDYYQGESYARASACEVLVCTNRRHTDVFKLVPGMPGDIVAINEIPCVQDWADAQRMQEVREGLRTFNRKEFQNLLFDCHSILRDVHKMDPGRAFDTISKILFIKMYVERSGLYGTFSVDFLDRRASTMLSGDRAIHDSLFDSTKAYYRTDELFISGDQLEVNEETFRRIVGKLERFDLSKTRDDVKGIAFEQFLGTTFRGELGQHFTPRPVVDFMIEFLDPTEGDVICDPAAGSGGFLIKAFEHVKTKIEADIQSQKDRAREELEDRDCSDDEKDGLISEAFQRLNLELLSTDDDNNPANSRVGHLAWDCIFGCDAEPRAARTAKMNMIMHGDGHGGIHYHDGLVDIDGIFSGRFDVVATNPPFGSNVGSDQKVGGTDATQVPDDRTYLEEGRHRYGENWVNLHHQMLDAVKNNKPILDLYETGAGKPNRPTETLFVERCLTLLRPGGRMGIVLPDGNLNNPSLDWLRRWAEGKARLLAVVSLPEETFHYSKTTAKTSVVFMRRFDHDDEAAWEAAWAKARHRCDAHFNSQRDFLCDSYKSRILTGDNYAVATVLSLLSAHGVTREVPRLALGQPSVYPRGLEPSKITAGRRWVGQPSGADAKAKVVALKRDYGTAFDSKTRERSKALLSELRQKIKVVDEDHNEALWAEVRRDFDYPVFVASPTSVGISAGTEDVPNELPAVLDAYRRFRDWCEDGALWEAMPDLS